jgi:hypothetical protein
LLYIYSTRAEMVSKARFQGQQASKQASAMQCTSISPS